MTFENYGDSNKFKKKKMILIPNSKNTKKVRSFRN